MTAPAQDEAQTRYEQAAATAAALYVASKVAPHPLDTIRHTLTTAADLTTAVADSTSSAIVALWRRTDPYDQRSVDKFVSAAGRLVVSAQRSTATIHVAAQLNQLKAVGIDTKVAVTIPDQVRGATVEFGNKVEVKAPARTTIDYKPTPGETAPKVSVTVRPENEKPVARTVVRSESAPEQLFNRAVVTYRYEVSTGADHSSANDAAEKRIDDLVNTNVMLAQRLAEQQTLQKVVDLDQKVTGYRRVFHPEASKGGSCGLCVAASERIYKISDLKPIHTNCKCTISPITADSDPGHRINQKDLDMLYRHAGTTSGRGPGTNLKRTRYILEEHQELGTVLTRVSGEKLPYTDDLAQADVARDAGTPVAASTSPRTTSPRTVGPQQVSPEFAAHQVTVLRSSLERLRSEGFAEDSSPVRYHLTQIAKFEAMLQPS